MASMMNIKYMTSMKSMKRVLSWGWKLDTIYLLSTLVRINVIESNSNNYGHGLVIGVCY